MDKIIIVILFSSICYANTWNPSYFGEKSIPDYMGPLGGDAKSTEVQGEFLSFGSGLFVHENEFYGQKNIEGEIAKSNDYAASINYTFFELMKNIEGFKSALICPQFEMTENYEYYRYLNRLISISYLFENLKYHNLNARKLNLNNTCEIDYKKLFKRCTPKSRDMKFFIKNVEVVLESQINEVIPFDHDVKKYENNWTENFKQKNYTDISQVRLAHFCERHNCKKITKTKNLKKSLNQVCKEDQDLIVKICSEEDRLFGLSHSIHAYNIIKNSDALFAVNENGFAKGCLRRFSIQNKDLENKNAVLKAIFPITYDYLSKNYDDRFIQGQLYPLGSLKLFLDQGLASFLEKEEKKVENKDKVVKEKIARKLPPLAPEPLKPFLKPKKIVKKKKKKKEVVKKEEVVKSHFLKAVELGQEYSLFSVDVEMDKFQFDYVFTPKMIKTLESGLKKFTTIDGLKEMQEYDYLGTPKGPVPLRFIKYLIDTENHTGIYNMISVLGEEFYVMNDIDDKRFVKKPNKIMLKNDNYTSYQWQIYILN